MFDFLKRKKDTETAEETPNAVEPQTEKQSFFSRLKQGLAKTRKTLGGGLGQLFLGKKVLDQELIEAIETALLSADVGIETTEKLINSLTEKLARKELGDAEAAFHCLRDEMKAILQPYAIPLTPPSDKKPFVILVVGVNGAGKTTTIGKIAKLFKNSGKSVTLAAGDTFRAAAVQQLQTWGERNDVPVIAQHDGADAAAVIFDAISSAKAKNMDIVLADTAGRLHTQSNLMTELSKVKRVANKADEGAPHEVLIVLDATIGQNTINQVRQFSEALDVTGIVLTKLDGTAKGGVIFTLAEQTKLPIRYIGVGEGIDDLRPFDADAFVEALLEIE